MIKGSCRRCGMCCKEAWRFVYEGYERDEKTGEYSKMVLARIKDKPEGNDGTCRRLRMSRKGIARCTIHNRKSGNGKRQVCRLFPRFKEELIFGGCGFYWEEK